MLRIHNFILLLTLLSTISKAQFPYLSKISSPDPLPTTAIYDLFADSKGYLWLGTDKGLIKYNSRTFQVIPFNTTQIKSLGAIQEDQEGTIWCTNYYNQIFYVKNDTAFNFEVKEIPQSVLSSVVYFTVNDTSLFLQNTGEVLEINKKSHAVKKFYSKSQHNANIILSFSQFNNGHFIFNKPNALHDKFNNQDYYSIHHFENMQLLRHNNQIIGIGVEKNRYHAFIFDGKSMRDLPDIDLPVGERVYLEVATGDDEYWLCTANGGYRWEIETGKTTLMFANNRVSKIVKDFQGNYWISTLDEGLFKCPNLNCKKINLNFPINTDNVTKLLLLPHQHILLGTSHGEIAEMNTEGKFVRPYKSGTVDEIEFLIYDSVQKRILSDATIFYGKNYSEYKFLDFGKMIGKDKYGNLILAYAQTCNISTPNFNDTTTLPSKEIPLYKNLERGLLNAAARKYKWVSNLRRARTNWVLGNEDGTGFWVAYYDGLYYYEYSGRISIIHDQNNLPIIGTFLLQHNDELIVCTRSLGLFVIKDHRIIKQFSTKNGLQSNYVKKVCFADNMMWVLTDEGLASVNYTNEKVQHFMQVPGLESMNIRDFFIYKNKIIIAGTHGIIVYEEKGTQDPKVINFASLQMECKGKTIPDHYALPYSSNSVVFNLDAIHYNSPSNLFFHSRMLGLDSNWKIYNSYNNHIEFNRLPAGKYIYEVFAADKNLDYKSDLRTFHFSIEKPWWQKTGFLILFILVQVCLIYYMAKWWMRRFKLQQSLKEHLMNDKLTAIRSQMNPHFLYNVLNTVQGLVYANRKTEAGELLGKFSELMRKILKESDQSEITLQSEIDSLVLYLELEKGRFDKDFEFEIHLSPNIHPHEISIPSMFIQPFVENAIKHGLLHKEGIKKLFINFILLGDNLLVKIIDNGIGRKKAETINLLNKVKSSGFAIKAISDRIKIYNQMSGRNITMNIIDQPEGTLVELQFFLK